MHHTSRRLSLSHLTGTSRFVRGLNLWSPKRSSSSASSAVIASDDEVPKSSRKKITKAERKSLLESFVNNYRAMNSGKFPSANMVQKEVGGGFYAVRKAIQVMEFETRMSCTRLDSQYLKTEVKDNKEKLKVEKTVEKSKAPEGQVLFGSQEIFGAEVLVNNSSSVTALEDKQVAREIKLFTEKDPVSSSPMNDDGIKILPNTSDSRDVQDPVLSSMINDEDIKILPHTLDSKAVQYRVSSSLMNGEDIKTLPNTSDSKDVQIPVTSSLTNDEDTKILPRTSDSKDAPGPVLSSLMNDGDIKILPHTPDSNVSSVDVGVNSSKCDTLVLEQDDYPGKSVVSSATDDKADVITQKNGMSDEESKHTATTPETSDLKLEKTITVDGCQHESSKIDDTARHTSREQDDNVKPPKKAFEWNLKSIADGIINFWKKL